MRIRWKTAALAMILLLHPLVPLAHGAPSMTLVPLTGQIVAVNGDTLTVVSQNGSQHYSILLTRRTTYWERARLATRDDVAAGARMLLWAQPRGHFTYSAVRMYFKLSYLNGSIAGALPSRLTIIPVAVAHRRPSAIALAVSTNIAVWEGKVLVSINQLAAHAHVGVLGYMHHSGAFSVRSMSIYPQYAAGTVVSHDPVSLALHNGRRTFSLYTVDITTIARGNVRLPFRSLPPGTGVWAYGYAQADGSIRATDLHLAALSILGLLYLQGRHLALVDGRGRQYLLDIPPSASLTYRHAQVLTVRDLHPGSKVSIKAYASGPQRLLVESLVVWTNPRPLTGTAG